MATKSPFGIGKDLKENKTQTSAIGKNTNSAKSTGKYDPKSVLSLQQGPLNKKTVDKMVSSGAVQTSTNSKGKTQVAYTAGSKSAYEAAQKAQKKSSFSYTNPVASAGELGGSFSSLTRVTDKLKSGSYRKLGDYSGALSAAQRRLSQLEEEKNTAYTSFSGKKEIEAAGLENLNFSKQLADALLEDYNATGEQSYLEAYNRAMAYYDHENSQYQSQVKDSAGFAEKYSQAQTAYDQAMAEYNALRQAQAADYNDWRGRVREDKTAITQELETVEQELAAAKKQSRKLEREKAHTVQGIAGQSGENLSQLAAGWSSGQAADWYRQQTQDYSARVKALEAKKELLEEELDWSCYFTYGKGADELTRADQVEYAIGQIEDPKLREQTRRAYQQANLEQSAVVGNRQLGNDLLYAGGSAAAGAWKGVEGMKDYAIGGLGSAEQAALDRGLAEAKRLGAVSQDTKLEDWTALMESQENSWTSIAKRHLTHSAAEDYQQRLLEKYDPSAFGKGLGTVTGAIGNMAPSIAAGLIAGPGAGLATLGLSAAGGAAQEAAQEGADMGQSFLYGTASGALEVLTEKLSSGANALFGKSALGRSVIEAAMEKVTKNKLVNALAESLGEGAEEVVSTWISPYLQRVIYNPEAQTATAEELAQSAILGAIVGGVFQATGSVGDMASALNTAGGTIQGGASNVGKSAINVNQSAGNVKKNTGSTSDRLATDNGALDTVVNPVLGDSSTRTSIADNQPVQPVQKGSATSTATVSQNPVDVNPLPKVEGNAASNRETAGDISASMDTTQKKEIHNEVLEKVQKSIELVKENGTVAKLTGTEFSQANGRRGIIDTVTEYFQKIGSVMRQGLGAVQLNRRGVRDSLGHGFGPKKVSAFAAVPDVIQKGVQIDYQENWKGRGYDTYIFAGMVDMGESPHAVGVVITHNKENNRYYLHEVMELEEDSSTPLHTGTSQTVSTPGGEELSSTVTVSQNPIDVNPLPRVENSPASAKIEDISGSTSGQTLLRAATSQPEISSGDTIADSGQEVNPLPKVTEVSDKPWITYAKDKKNNQPDWMSQDEVEVDPIELPGTDRQLMREYRQYLDWKEYDQLDSESEAINRRLRDVEGYLEMFFNRRRPLKVDADWAEKQAILTEAAQATVDCYLMNGTVTEEQMDAILDSFWDLSYESTYEEYRSEVNAQMRESVDEWLSPLQSQIDLNPENWKRAIPTPPPVEEHLSEEEAKLQWRLRSADTETERSGVLAGASEEAVQTAERISKATGRRILFYDGDAEGGPWGQADGFYNGSGQAYEPDTIYVNARSGDPAASIIAHELTHSIEGTDGYRQVWDYALHALEAEGESLEMLREHKRAGYEAAGVDTQTLTEEYLNRELVAEYWQQHLLTDEKTILQLATEKPSLGQRILQWIRRLAAKFSRGSRERVLLDQARDAYRAALKEAATLRGQETAWNRESVERAYRNGEMTDEEFDSAIALVEEDEALSQPEALEETGYVPEVTSDRSIREGNTDPSQQESAEEQYSIDADFSRRFDEWLEHGNRTRNQRLRVGRTSEVLQSIGVRDNGIYWDTNKIQKTMRDHPEMTAEILKQVPDVLENPVVVMQSKQKDSRIIMFGELYDTAGSPVLAVMELQPTKRDGSLLLDTIMLASTYGKENAQTALDTNRILYLDKERTDTWLGANRLQLPFALTPARYGSIGTIAYPNEDVNPEPPYSIPRKENSRSVDWEKVAQTRQALRESREGEQVADFTRKAMGQEEATETAPEASTADAVGEVDPLTVNPLPRVESDTEQGSASQSATLRAVPGVDRQAAAEYRQELPQRGASFLAREERTLAKGLKFSQRLPDGEATDAALLEAAGEVADCYLVNGRVTEEQMDSGQEIEPARCIFTAPYMKFKNLDKLA